MRDHVELQGASQQSQPTSCVSVNVDKGGCAERRRGVRRRAPGATAYPSSAPPPVRPPPRGALGCARQIPPRDVLPICTVTSTSFILLFEKRLKTRRCPLGRPPWTAAAYSHNRAMSLRCRARVALSLNIDCPLTRFALKRRSIRGLIGRC
eukprot:COSAG05_NODE_3253_length_2201_cov_32.697431_1_plen_151_part_00